jgi:NAD(P)-dependent dehydrogenase (short-subunit alcohol dehydrogenase family)
VLLIRNSTNARDIDVCTFTCPTAAAEGASDVLTAAEKHGDIDILINNVGIFAAKKFGEFICTVLTAGVVAFEWWHVIGLGNFNIVPGTCLCRCVVFTT